MTETQDFLREVENEVKRAEVHYPKLNSLHEAYAVILEELDEVWDEIKKKNPDLGKIRKELIQVAAMCARTNNDIDLASYISAQGNQYIGELQQPYHYE